MSFQRKGYVFWIEGKESWHQKVIANSLEEAKEELIGEYKDHKVYQLYHVIEMSEEGDKLIGSYWDEDEADEMCDMYSEQYPNAFVDVFCGDDF